MSLFSSHIQRHLNLGILFHFLLLALSNNLIAAAHTPPQHPSPNSIHYDPPISLTFSTTTCTPAQISSLKSELNLIRNLSKSLSKNWENRNHSMYIREAYEYFYTAGDAEGPLYEYGSKEVRGGLRRVLERLGKMHILEREHREPRERGKGKGEGIARPVEGLRIVCKPNREADCGDGGIEGVEAFVGNGPTVRVGRELESLYGGRVGSGGSDAGNPKSKGKGGKAKNRKWLSTNGNDVYLCPLFWKNKSLDIPNPLEKLREIPVGDFVDYRLLTLMHELTHTHLLTGDLYLSSSHEHRLSLGLLDHGYGLRHPRSNENPDYTKLPRVYGERIVRKYDSNGKAVGKEVKGVPYLTELRNKEAWGNADTFVYFVFVAWRGQGQEGMEWCEEGTEKTPLLGAGRVGEERGVGRAGEGVERVREITKKRARNVWRVDQGQRVLKGETQGGGVMSGKSSVTTTGECKAMKCRVGTEPEVEVLRGSDTGKARKDLKRWWCKPVPGVN